MWTSIFLNGVDFNDFNPDESGTGNGAGIQGQITNRRVFDLNGNDKVSDEEKIYGNLSSVISKIESTESKELKNLPIEYLHLSVDKKNATPEAVAFLKWVIENGQKDLHAFGFLTPQTTKKEKEKFEQFANGRSK